MTDILCKWLNNDVKLSRKIDNENFAFEFKTGYLIGEVLHSYQLQDDFEQFSKNNTANARLNNFIRVEPTLNILEIPFDTNIARDVMTEKRDAATRVLYQLYVALQKKEQSGLTGVAMETMKSTAPIKLEAVQSILYKERLKKLTPRQSDINLNQLGMKFHDKQQQHEKVIFKEKFEEDQLRHAKLMQERDLNMKKYAERQSKQSIMLAKIQAAVLYVPKPPTNKTLKAIADRKQNAKQKIVDDTIRDVKLFDDRLSKTVPQSKTTPSEKPGEKLKSKDYEQFEYIREKSNTAFINEIRRRLNEDKIARTEREKRRRKVMVDQMKASEAQEAQRREEIIVARLMRRSQQERRICVQLLQNRHEKFNITKNRCLQEKRFEVERIREFEEAMDRESELARLSKIQYAEQTKLDQELHQHLMNERALQKYEKHYGICRQILSDIVDMALKIGEYRELTNQLLPPKLIREWKTLFLNGQPLFEVQENQPQIEEIETAEEIQRQQLLNETELVDYRNMTGEWNIETISLPRINPILGHIVQRIFDFVHPQNPLPIAPIFPPASIKAFLLGKMFSGKSTLLKKLVQFHNIQVLSMDDLISKAIEAFNNGEIEELPVEDPPEDPEMEPVADVDVKPFDSTNLPLADSDAFTPIPIDHASVSSKPTPDIPLDANDIQSNQYGEIDDSPVQNIASNQSESCYPMASKRAEIGKNILDLIQNGEQVSDKLLILLLVDAIRHIDNGFGWITDGFPTTYEQAKLLEIELSGFDVDSVGPVRKGKDHLLKEVSVLAPDPKPQEEKVPPKSAVDLIIKLDLSDEICLRRSTGRTKNPNTNDQFHEEFNPPPEGSITGLGESQTKVVEVSGDNEEHIQERLNHFEDNWTKLEEWFTQYSCLDVVNASQEAQIVYEQVEAIIEKKIKAIEGQDYIDELTESLKAEDEEEKRRLELEIQQQQEEEDKEKQRLEDLEAKKELAKSAEAEAVKTPKSPAKSAKSSAKERATSSKAASVKGKKTKTPDPEPVVEVERPITPPIQPGSQEWKYVDLAIEKEISSVLVSHWEILENSYLNHCKGVFKKLRIERELLIRYLHRIREEYLNYLRRPDHKQEFVIEWQKDYNKIAKALRADEETKSELHQRVDDIRDRLWTICDEKKQAAENERDAILCDGWLLDHLSLLTNAFVTLMQAEVDRYQDTVNFLKDYYDGMQLKIPFEPTTITDYPRLVLTQIAASDLQTEKAVENVGENNCTPLSNETTPTQRTTNADLVPCTDDSRVQRIPTIARRPGSGDLNNTLKQKQMMSSQAKVQQKGNEESPTLTSPLSDTDEKIIFTAYTSASGFIDNIITMEQAAQDEIDEKERQRMADIEAEKLRLANEAKKKAGKAGKAKKSASPTGKKGGKGVIAESAETTPVPEESPEEIAAKENKARAVLEFFAAIKEEGASALLRLDVIRNISSKLICELKNLSNSAYQDMYDWLGARFLQEMKAIDELSEIFRFGIENEEIIKDELILDQSDFLITSDVKLRKSPSPPPPPPLLEQPTENIFTIQQLDFLHQQFASMAPQSLISVKIFVQTLVNYCTLSYGTEILPSMWHHLTGDRIETMAGILAADGEYIDWLLFVLELAEPWPQASLNDLLAARQRFLDLDQRRCGLVTREQYDRVNLWFSTDGDDVDVDEEDNTQAPPRPINFDPVLLDDRTCEQLINQEENLQRAPAADSGQRSNAKFDRLAALKRSLFDWFSVEQEDGTRTLDYITMLLYFSASASAYEGFIRAMSVAIGTPVETSPVTQKLSIVESLLMRGKDSPQSHASIEANSGQTATVIIHQSENETHLKEIPISASYEATPSATVPDTLVPVQAFYKVLHHGHRVAADSHRYNEITAPEDIYSMERLKKMFSEIGATEGNWEVPFRSMLEHPVLADIITNTNHYHTVDIRSFIIRNFESNEITPE